MVSPWTFLIFFVLFWGLNLSLKIISFGSIIATLATIVIIWVMPLYQVTNLTSTSQPLANKYLWFNQLHAMTIANYGDSLLMIALTVTGSGMIVIGKHYQNLIRLFRCQEQKYHFQTTTATK